MTFGRLLNDILSDVLKIPEIKSYMDVRGVRSTVQDLNKLLLAPASYNEIIALLQRIGRTPLAQQIEPYYVIGGGYDANRHLAGLTNVAWGLEHRNPVQSPSRGGGGGGGRGRPRRASASQRGGGMTTVGKRRASTGSVPVGVDPAISDYFGIAGNILDIPPGELDRVYGYTPIESPPGFRQASRQLAGIDPSIQQLLERGLSKDDASLLKHLNQSRIFEQLNKKYVQYFDLDHMAIELLKEGVDPPNIRKFLVSMSLFLHGLLINKRIPKEDVKKYRIHKIVSVKPEYKGILMRGNREEIVAFSGFIVNSVKAMLASGISEDDIIRLNLIDTCIENKELSMDTIIANIKRVLQIAGRLTKSFGLRADQIRKLLQTFGIRDIDNDTVVRVINEYRGKQEDGWRTQLKKLDITDDQILQYDLFNQIRKLLHSGGSDVEMRSQIKKMVNKKRLQKGISIPFQSIFFQQGGGGGGEAGGGGGKKY